MWCYRRILRVSWKDHVTNREILQRVGLEDPVLLQTIMKRKTKYAGHLMRGSSGALLNLALEGFIDGQRSKGRQRRTWGDDIKEWTGSKNIGYATRFAENRYAWRVIVAHLRIEDGT